MRTHSWQGRSLVALACIAAACTRGDQPKPAGTATLATPSLPHDRAPAMFRTRFETSAGTFLIEVHRDWAPIGADRFYNLVKSGYFDGGRFFRVIPGFMAQFGISSEPHITAAWRDQQIPDDPVRASNTRGMVSFATAGPNTRTTQIFINYGDNRQLDASGFAPFGQVVEGMEVVDRLYAGYGEGAPRGRGPYQGQIEAGGEVYLAREFPKLDRVQHATLVAP